MKSTLSLIWVHHHQIGGRVEPGVEGLIAGDLAGGVERVDRVVGAPMRLDEVGLPGRDPGLVQRTDLQLLGEEGDGLVEGRPQHAEIAVALHDDGGEGEDVIDGPRVGEAALVGDPARVDPMAEGDHRGHSGGADMRDHVSAITSS
jgi:hypothetical protein